MKKTTTATERKGRSKYLAAVHSGVPDNTMSPSTQQWYDEVERRLGAKKNTNAMEALVMFVQGHQRDVIRAAISGVEDSCADVFANAIIGDEKGTGFAACGYWDEISGLLMSMWGYPVVLDHEQIATELGALEGQALAQAYRDHVATLTARLGAQTEPHDQQDSVTQRRKVRLFRSREE